MDKHVIEPTEEEKKVIASLKRLAKKWPSTVWLFVDGNSVHVMRIGETERHATTGRGQGIDPDYILDSVNIDCDGGDW